MISPQIYQLLEECYSVGSIQTIGALTGGEWNQVFRLDCDKGTFVLRISHPTNTAASLAYEHRLLQFINQRVPEVPPPIFTRDGSTYLQHGGVLITLFPFMPGRMLEDANEEECMTAARMFARLQRVGLEYPDLSPRPNKPRFCELDWENNDWWRWNEVESLLFHQADAFLETVRNPDRRVLTEQIFAKRIFIAQEREVLRDWVAVLQASQRSLLFAPTHCDYWCNNILVMDGQISAVVDWDGYKAEWLFYALGRATWDFGKNKHQHRLDCQKAIRFLQAYQSAGGPVPSMEFDLLVPVMRCICLIEILLGLQLATESGLNNHVLHHLLSLENLQNVELIV
ncbi:MAG: phosphotransferase [Symploca sp. SIO2G7]|nr:phosphotransferase [Symploca sp. SIO2G7]